MPDVAAADAGGQVVMVTSLDCNHPAENMLDGSSGSYWISTGLYPQEILIGLGKPVRVSEVTLHSTSVRSLRIEGCQEDKPVNFTTLAEAELEDSQGVLQTRQLHCPGEQRAPQEFIRLVLLSGWHDFCSVHRLSVDGEVDESVRAAKAAAVAAGMNGARNRKASKQNSMGGFLRQDTKPLEIEIPKTRSTRSDEPDAPREPADTTAWSSPRKDEGPGELGVPPRHTGRKGSKARPM
eukprot:TRINITY_DN13351_c0_g1_i1.p2 TRINITY_DN13351_c0_g1~~TRINITY_DN13351_c0_g1_i1.p2  ORF type:complete len:237 (-),score=52.16 TRINITY_DN13351_c0_g1_i1:67-777(-)